MGACAAQRWTPRVGTARGRPRVGRGDARAASRPGPAVVSARSEDSRDPEPDAGDVSVGGDGGPFVVDPWKTGASSSGSAPSSMPETTTTALALVPPTTALSPLMSRLNARSRTFVYEALGGMSLEMRQAWSEEDAGTGSAVWDAAAALADDLARDGAAVALSRFWSMAEDGERVTTAPERADERADDDARAWWRGKTVVELGAGLGTASLVAAALGARALATDGDETVCAMCSRNARINADAVLDTARGRRERSDCESILDDDDDARVPECRRLFWGDDGDARAAKAWIRARTNYKTDTPDAILLADVVYGEYERIWSDLVKTIRSLARLDTVVIMSHARRGSGRGCKVFRGFARDAGFRVAVAETKSEPKDGFVAVTVTYVLRLVDADTANEAA